MAVTVQNDSQAHRFVTTVDGHSAHLDYVQHKDGVLNLIHTEVDPALRGQGVGEAVVRFALDEARRNGTRIIPTCPFVKRFLERHGEYQDLVAKPA